MSPRSRSESDGFDSPPVSTRNGGGDFDSSRPAPIHLAIPRRWMAAFLVAMICPWILLGVMLFIKVFGPVDDHTSSQAMTVVAKPTYRALPGPWGDLQCIRFVIAPPAQFLGRLRLPEFTGWHFPDMSVKQVQEFLGTAELPPLQQAHLLENLQPDPGNNGCVIQPPLSLLRELSPHSRATIYARLAASPQNAPQYRACNFWGDSPEEWFEDFDLPPRIVQMVKPLIYHNGSFMFFADHQLVFPAIADPREQQQLLHVLSRDSTLLIKMLIEDDADSEALAAYWGRGGRTSDVLEEIKSLRRIPGMQRLDITHLLPPFARQRIYTYPSPTTDAADSHLNSTWTALNFFNPVPNDSYADPEQADQAIRSEYVPVAGSPRFGDLVLLYSQKARDSHPLHAAVYIADDIVFTKNGSDLARPWIFLKLRSVHDFYPQAGELNIRFARRKDLQ